MGTNSSKRASKYNRHKAAIKSDKTAMSKETTDKPDNSENSESHDEFLKAAEDSVKETGSKVTLEPVNDKITNPHVQPKIHRGYALDGISKKETEPVVKTGDKKEPPTPTTENPTSETVTPKPTIEEEEFVPSDPGDAPTSKGPTAGSENPEGPITEPFVLPTGDASDLIEQGATALNYLIDQYGDTLIGIKIHQDFYLVPRVIPLIRAHNTSSIEKIKLSPQEIAMLKKPLIKIMQEKGIKGLTPGEELAVVVVIIIVAKVKVVVQIRQDSKKLQASFIEEVNSLKELIARQNPPSPSVKHKPEIKDEDIPLSETEEVK